MSVPTGENVMITQDCANVRRGLLDVTAAVSVKWIMLFGRVFEFRNWGRILKCLFTFFLLDQKEGQIALQYFY